MKNSLVIGMLGAIMCMYVAGCKNKCNTACDPVFPEVKFKIVNAGDENLIAGPGKIYTSNRVQVKSFVSNTLTEVPKYYTGDSLQSNAYLNFVTNALSTQYYLYIDNVKTDSFQVVYQNNPGNADCCPAYNAITSLKINTVNTNYTNPGTSDAVNIIK